MASTLTWRQRLFVSALLNDPKASHVNAAKAAGYRNPAKAACNIVKNPLVRWAIESKTKADAISATECLARMSEVAQFDQGEFVRFNPNTGRPFFDLEALKKAGKFHLVKKLKILPDGNVEIEFHDSQTALDKLAKHHGLFRERIEFEQVGGAIAGHSDRVIAIVDQLSKLTRTVVLREGNRQDQPSLVCDGGEPISVGASKAFALPEPEVAGLGGRTDQQIDHHVPAEARESISP